MKYAYHNRNIEKYAKDYSNPGFESYQLKYRRKHMMEIIKQYNSKRILEIGSGHDPLVKYLDSNIKLTVVEPSQEFYSILCEYRQAGRIFINSCFEDVADDLQEEYDMVLCASLLHELRNPRMILNKIKKVMTKDTILYVNVPNANSLHRLIAKEMGVINDTHIMSERNFLLQQTKVFDLDGLSALMEICGFRVKESGTFFLKPFTHNQMYHIMEDRIIDDKVLDGLYIAGKNLGGDIGSEIYILAQLRKE